MKSLASPPAGFGAPGSEPWERYAALAELWWSRHAGGDAGIARQRLCALVDFARAASPFYARLYAHLPRGEVPLAALPVVDKARLMARFDDWSTDRAVSRAGVERFLAGRPRIGAPYLDRYRVWKSSGTSGTPGIFLQDEHALSIYEALVLAQWAEAGPDLASGARAWRSAGRAALVAADGDHYASIEFWDRLGRSNPGLLQRSFSVLEPVASLVARLNDYRPAFLASYPSVLRLLAGEQAAGRLAIEPALLWSGGEHLGHAARARIEAAFGCRVMNEYGASECMSIAFGCREGWLHVNSEWVIAEGVDAHGAPVRPGELSHTALVTNLANRVQPIIRYDLGDRIVAAPGPCACGNPRPAIRVEGRNDATVELRVAGHAPVALPPLALSTVVEEAAGEHRFQVAQVAPDRLVVRFDAAVPRAERLRIGRRAVRALEAWLASQSLHGARVGLATGPPRTDPRSGKLHAVTVEQPWRANPRR